MRRWSAVATIVPLTVLAGTGAAAPRGHEPPGQARPVVDAAFLYNELYFLATNFIFRVAGADGPLSDPADPNNLPPNDNGAQEFYRWFAREMTNSDAAHMGPLGRFMTAKDHLYPTRIWQLNDLSVTIPGQDCAGQVALIAGHNDSTPTSTAVANGAANGSPTPMTGMRGGNWGNGSAYDAGSGEAMGMAEFQALLRWYQANGTYPKRTINNGYWFWGRPSVDDLWRDLRAATSEIRPDWDLSTPGLREAWAAGDYSPFHGWDRRSGEPSAAP